MSIRDQIIQQLKDAPGAMSPKRLALTTGVAEEKILMALRALMRDSRVHRVDRNFFDLATVNKKYHKILGTLEVLLPLLKEPHSTHIEVLRNDIYYTIERQKRSFRG